ncbi:MAG: hypothetical protein HZA31_02105 [Opitutae bacterium]|nr:hypothetical protein [Opitutae bacterium]
MKKSLRFLPALALLALAALTSSALAALPGGKANFSVTCGNMDLNGYTWVRIINWTFNANGSVAATSWTWDTNNKLGKYPFNSHRCTFDGVTNSNATTYTPYGWVYPSGQYVNWAGTYTYNSSTGRLDITWSSPSAGATDSWTVTAPDSTIVRVNLISSNYTLTHGHGYGSNAAWSTFKTMDQVPRVTYSSTTGKYVVASYYNGTLTITPSTAGAWGKAGCDLAQFTSPSSPIPINCLHAWLPTTACATTIPPCTTTRTGIIYHLASENNSRQMAYSNWCACLPSNSAWPVYTGNMHPSAMIQIIDDTGAMRGMIGVETQNPPSGQSGYPNYQLTLWDFTQIPW